MVRTLVQALRLWTVHMLRTRAKMLEAWAAALDQGEVPAGAVPTGRVGVGDPHVPLALAAAEWVGRLSSAQVTGTSKRQIAFRAIRRVSPGAATWEINLAIEEALRDLKGSRVVQGEEEASHG